MPTFYDQLKEAQVENLAAAPSNLPAFRFWGNTLTGKISYYDPVAATNRVVSTGVTGGSIGGGILWLPDDTGPAAADTIEFGQKVWKFANGLTQKIFAVIKVSSSYSAGDQINLRCNVYSPDNSGTGLLQSVATLIRVGTDSFSSITNQYTSTNTTLTFSSANVARAVTLDITSGTGTINSVAVSAGDIIKIQLSRASGTSPSEMRFIESSVEVTLG